MDDRAYQGMAPFNGGGHAPLADEGPVPGCGTLVMRTVRGLFAASSRSLRGLFFAVWNGRRPCSGHGYGTNRAFVDVLSELCGDNESQALSHPFPDRGPFRAQDRIERCISDRVVGAARLRAPDAVELRAECFGGRPGAGVADIGLQRDAVDVHGL